MAIERAVELLREDLKRVLQGSGEFDQIGVTIKNAKFEVVKRYGSVFAPSQIPLISAEEFRGFLLFKNNQHWDSLHRQGPQMTADMEQLRRALTILVDESKPVRQRLDQLRPANRDAMVKGLGRATITAILQIVDADHYGIVNNTAELGMKALGIWPTFPYKATFGERYEAINAVLLKIASLLPTDLWTLDMLWWHMQPHVPTGTASRPRQNRMNSKKALLRRQQPKPALLRLSHICRNFSSRTGAKRFWGRIGIYSKMMMGT